METKERNGSGLKVAVIGLLGLVLVLGGVLLGKVGRPGTQDNQQQPATFVIPSDADQPAETTPARSGGGSATRSVPVFVTGSQPGSDLGIVSDGRGNDSNDGTVSPGTQDENVSPGTQPDEYGTVNEEQQPVGPQDEYGTVNEEQQPVGPQDEYGTVNEEQQPVDNPPPADGN